MIIVQLRPIECGEDVLCKFIDHAADFHAG